MDFKKKNYSFIPFNPSNVTKGVPTRQITNPAPVINNGDARVEPIRGVSARVVQSMEASLTVPTATSVRAVPAKLLIDNRIVINNHMKRARGGKISFTHFIGLLDHPQL